ncbi:exonuclease SbcCD subunit D [Eubacterium coprostanoligenes]|uniref:Nuclease SbcCD subunit D n=1 Tax=Eubacterium coprostanoligenes TaxID=290054 RepID=A0A1T4JVC1_9FIRM|nr:exonuclease SbcCD subunit D [Eubacterium coprostanoligenes]SJZ34098.1 Exodeoxyribonuclease I subunit D [Eubacterium coprostanoligenes]
MKLLHLADLHIGKRVNEFSMIEDQRYILTKILNIIDEEKPDAILIAGDVYDKSVPSSEAVEVLDKFINDIASRKIETFIISGNHDGAERLAFASKLIDTTGIHISPAYNGNIDAKTLNDEYGSVNFYMLPFIKPINVKQIFKLEENISYSEAVKIAIEKMNIDKSQRNVLLSHQFVTGAEECDSEDLSVGGTEGVSASVYEDFDYVALGHIHGPQRVSRDTIRYSGTPLKYSFSEVNHKKSVTIVNIEEKGNVTVSTIPLNAKRDLVELKGKYDELMDKSFYDKKNLDDYYHITLTDENDVVDAIFKLGKIYKNIMKLDYDNARTQSIGKLTAVNDVEHKQPIELIDDFYKKQNGLDMDENQLSYINSIIEKIWEEQK